MSRVSGSPLHYINPVTRTANVGRLTGIDGILMFVGVGYRCHSRPALFYKVSTGYSIYPLYSLLVP